MGTLLGGVDEAGRGCLVGPLVVAGVATDREGVKMLKAMGVRDSKKLSRKKRESLCPEIKRVCRKVSSAWIGPAEIDSVVRTGKKYRKLNYLEALYFARVIDQLAAVRVTVDASDTSPERFRDFITRNMKGSTTVRAVHKADRDYPAVAAASIVAKVERDLEVERLRTIHGDFGSGYPSDPTTRDFFTRMLQSGEQPPDYTRKSWKSWDRFEQRLLVT